MKTILKDTVKGLLLGSLAVGVASLAMYSNSVYAGNTYCNPMGGPNSPTTVCNTSNPDGTTHSEYYTQQPGGVGTYKSAEFGTDASQNDNS
jgi:hypothetical protein